MDSGKTHTALCTLTGTATGRDAWVMKGGRVSDLDLEDEDITGGHERNVTVGLNWYLNVNVRTLIDSTWMHAEPNDDGIDEDPRVLQLALIVSF